MDIKLLKDNNLYESHKRFKKLYEYTFVSNDLNEDDDDNDSGGDDIMNTPDKFPKQETPRDMTNNEPVMEPDGEKPNTDMGDEEADKGDMDAPQLGDTLDNSTKTTDGEDEDMEVVDVDDLTKAQEKSEDKIKDVDDKIGQLIDMLGSFSDKLNQNDAKIEDLKKEFELRNPTEVERLNLRSQDSMPFTVSPRDYWEDKSRNSNYKADFNNSVAPNKEKKEYIIRNGDISNITNLKGISDTIDDEDIDLDINKIFGL